MPGRGKGRMSSPISARITAATVALMPGIGIRRSRAARKGPSASSNARFERGQPPPRARRSAGQVQLEHEAMMGRHPTVQRVDQLACERLEPSRVRLGQRSGSVSPAIRALQHRPAALAEQVADRLLVSFTFASSENSSATAACADAVSRTSCVRVRVRSRRSWIGAGGTKLLPDQPHGQQIRDPLRVLHVALASGDVPDVLRIGQHQRPTAPSSRCQTGFQ